LFSTLSKPLDVEDRSGECDLSRVSHDALYHASRVEFAINKAVSRLLFWFCWAPLALSFAAFVVGLVLRKG
jgi:hypothetical protein